MSAVMRLRNPDVDNTASMKLSDLIKEIKKKKIIQFTLVMEIDSYSSILSLNFMSCSVKLETEQSSSYLVSGQKSVLGK